MREELPELAHVPKAVRQAIHVEELRVEAGHGDGGRVQPVAGQGLTLERAAIQLGLGSLPAIPAPVLHKAVAFALTCHGRNKSIPVTSGNMRKSILQDLFLPVLSL